MANSLVKHEIKKITIKMTGIQVLLVSNIIKLNNTCTYINVATIVYKVTQAKCLHCV